ncbi:LodA/GoxA family CTQ-dependent oxidase [Pseudoalteromonas fenneropenaei]|uniref:LodA/GoxA family CTQ-dependent oxidase n=1 Tax=Pseudoalteromonas fenneropenaei TaxID=1737459 RepID=A0ABV7CN17_9GAMM
MSHHHCAHDADIVSAAIYPPIGVMRVGNSPTEYFIGPEVNQPFAHDNQYYRDATGALKRQAARFRIYGFDAQGNVVKELTADNATITWHARLANQKASWYQFQLALDIPEAAEADPSLLRNATVKDRSTLLIDGGQHSVCGKNQQGSNTRFVGCFEHTSVYLGEMRTDNEGRLVMLGGHGKSANPQGKPAVTFGNNEGWYDDTSDGPITAEVQFAGKSLPVKPAWVVCAPPDYAPMQKSVRTMWDLMRDVAVEANLLAAPGIPSFTHDILPIFQRLTDLQWVNAGFAAGFGWQSPFDFRSEQWLMRLSDPSETWQAARRTLFHNFRNLDTAFSTPNASVNTQSWDPKFTALSVQQWPWLYGDAMSVNANASPRQFVTLTRLQLNALADWVRGEFIADYDPRTVPPQCLADVPLAEQPDMLTRAAMEFCLADAFHPGCEMTWPMRTAGLYSEAFRLRHAVDTAPTHGINYGPVMTSQIALQPDGPILSGQVAGGITRWMAIPWQTDTASCRDGYNLAYDPYLPTFWPARVPNNMLNETNYAKVIDESLPLQTRQQAFNEREFWLDDLPIGPSTNYEAQINSMIDNFADLAIVLPQTKPGDSHFPNTMQVGMTPQKPAALLQTKAKMHTELQHLTASERRPDLSRTDKANRFGGKY